MIPPKLELGMFGALAASVGVFWSQLQGFFARLRSLVVVSAHVSTGYATESVMSYCWRHYKSSRFGVRTFLGVRAYLRAKDRYCIAPYEINGIALTFFDGWKPLFVSTPTDKNGGGQTTITFIRGTFDIEKLFIDSVAELDELNMVSTTENSRYYVRKLFGSRANNANSKQSDDSESPSIASQNSLNGTEKSSKLLRYKPDELGPPKDEKPFFNLAYQSHIVQFEEEIRRWKKSEEWHKKKGLPWRFGAGLFGPPGTGKTSFARAMGQELDMPIHIYDLTSMDNKELSNHWRTTLSCSPCIVLFEDIDRIFDKNRNIIRTKDGKGVTLDALLNCINGVEPSDGILTFITANDMTKLDPALGVPDENGKSSRPGRLDRGVYFGPLSEMGRRQIAERILEDCPEFIEQNVRDGENETGAQFESRCAKIALENYWGAPKTYKDQVIRLDK